MTQHNSLETNNKLIKVFNTSLYNVDGYRNTPDHVEFNGIEYSYDDGDAIPFIYFKPLDKVYFGHAGRCHDEPGDKITAEVFGNYEKFKFVNDKLPELKMLEKLEEFCRDANITLEQFFHSPFQYIGWNPASKVHITYGGICGYENTIAGVCGRVWTVDYEDLGKRCAIFAFWDDNTGYMTDDADLFYIIRKVQECLMIRDRETYLADYTSPYHLVSNGDYVKREKSDAEKDELKKLQAIHLMNAHDKRDALAPFRTTRDKLWGKKLTNSRTGQEMPMAQYNALRYVDENVIKESVDKDLEEKVRKTVRDMIKDGDLPKSYDGEPLEMAEHYTHILKKVFGDDYEIYHTQDMEDDDICCAVIDDEFKKNGGHYDMDDCENHLKSVKKWLDKIIKEEYSMMPSKKIYLTESQVSYIKTAIANARKETNTNPTEGQKEAGNYKMGRVKVLGFDIAIENPKGSYRRGKDRNGKEWSILMKNDYGYFTHTKAIDGDAVDVFLGNDFDSKSIFAIDQQINNKFDETKVMLGFKTEKDAREAYLSNYEKGWKGLWRVTEVSIEDFKDWLYDGYKQRKPFSEYNEIKKKKLNENVDFYRKEKLILGDDTDYVHVIDEEFDSIISEYENKNVTPFLTKESIDEIVDDGNLEDVLQSFNIQKQLNPKFWINGKLNSRVRLRLLDIADAFFDSMDVDWVKPKDIIMTGSLANYNWSKFSDIDLHIVVDFKDVDDRTEFVKDYFDSKKTIWNNSHENLKIYGYQVELYVQDENEGHTASGIYSLEKDKWLKEPERDDLAAVKLDKKRIIHKTKIIVDKIDKLDDEYNGEKDTKKLDILSEKVKKLFDNIKGMRKDSLKNCSEMSDGNIIFKILRRIGYIGKLVDLKRLTFDKINSIK